MPIASSVHNFCLLIEHPRYQHSHKRGNRDAHQTGHHKTVIQKVFANDSGAGAVEIDGCNIARIIRDEEVSIDARQNAQQNGSRNAQRIRQRQHCNHDCAL